MAFDSSTLCARTSAGDAELATASLGLSLGQRRVLTLLQNPVAVDELAQKNRLEPEKLARDLTRLAELHLIVLQGPTMVPEPEPVPVAPLSRPQAALSMAPVIIGHRSRRLLPLAVGAAAVVLAVGIWYGTRASESMTATVKPPAAATTPQLTATSPSPVPVGALPVVPAPEIAMPVSAVPGLATVLRGNPALPETRPEMRAGSLVTSPASPKSAAPLVPEAQPAPRPESSAGSAAPTPPAAVPVAPSTTPPANAPNPGQATAADVLPPVQLAAAAPTSTPPRAAATAELKAISREAPDFPKEAIADGFKTGIVNARIHVDARGNVTGVDILGSQPPKVFDRAARRALLRWQFEPNAAGHAADLDVDVKFQRD